LNSRYNPGGRNSVQNALSRIPAKSAAQTFIVNIESVVTFRNKLPFPMVMQLSPIKWALKGVNN
jgi:hypothetical protein